MGISSSAIGPLLFPAPNPPCYRPTSFPAEMLWLPRFSSQRKSRLPCFFAQVLHARGLMIYFHGNGCDLGEMSAELIHYSQVFQMNVLGVEWTGYGYNLGKSSEELLNQDALDAWTFVTSQWKAKPERIVLFGRSIGTGPAVWLAHLLTMKQVPLAALILQSPYTSINGVVAHLASRAAAALIAKIWPSATRISTIVCPLLVIHGEKDELIPSVQGIALFELAGTPETLKTLRLCKNSDHNVWNENADIYDPIFNFLEQKTDLKGSMWSQEKEQKIAAVCETEVNQGCDTTSDFKVVAQLFVVPPEVTLHYQKLEDAARAQHEKRHAKKPKESVVSNSLSSVTSATKSSFATTSAFFSKQDNARL